MRYINYPPPFYQFSVKSKSDQAWDSLTMTLLRYCMNSNSVATFIAVEHSFFFSGMNCNSRLPYVQQTTYKLPTSIYDQILQHFHGNNKKCDNYPVMWV